MSSIIAGVSQFVAPAALQKIGGTYGVGTAGQDYLEAWRLSQTSTFLDWPPHPDPYNNVYGYRIYRNSTGGFAHLAYVPAGTTEFTDGTCVPNQEYNYTISVLFKGEVSGTLNYANSFESEYDSFPVRSVPDGERPQITVLDEPLDPTVAGSTPLNVTVTVSDDTDVEEVRLVFTSPGLGAQNVSMSGWDLFTINYGGNVVNRSGNWSYVIPDTVAGQVVWYGYDGDDDEIFLYDSATETTTRLTNNHYCDREPQIDDGQVAWRMRDGHDWEIFLAAPREAGEELPPGLEEAPAGWSEGKKEGWEGDVPPGFDKGKKEGWDK